VPGTVLENATDATVLPLHATTFATVSTVGIGLIVIVKVFAVPVHVTPAFVYEGVTVMVAVTGTGPAFVAVKEGMLPLPEDTRPIDVVLLDQEYTVPGTVPEKATEATVPPLHATTFAIAFTVGIGLTVMVNVAGVPVHIAVCGVTVTVPEIGAVPGLVAVKDAMAPVPDAARPIAGLEFAQL
jgi:hypothetical protein